MNANHQNLGDTLLLAHMIIALNITNPGAGIWCIWGAYKVLPPLWSCGLMGHVFLSKETMAKGADFSHFSDGFTYVCAYLEGGCKTPILHGKSAGDPRLLREALNLGSHGN